MLLEAPAPGGPEGLGGPEDSGDSLGAWRILGAWHNCFTAPMRKTKA